LNKAAACVALAVLAGEVAAPHAIAATEVATNELPTGVLRIGVPGDYAPYAWSGAGVGEPIGADIALARKLASDLGLRAQFVSTTWASLMEDARHNKFDIALGGVSITPARAQEFMFSAPYAHDSKQPVVRCGEERRFDTEREINQSTVRLIVNPGGTNEAFARTQFPAAKLLVHRDNHSVFDEIRARRADVMVTDGVEARLQARRGQGLCAVRVKKRWAPASKAVLVVRDKRLLAAANRAVTYGRNRVLYAQALVRWEAFDWAGANGPGARMARLIDARLALVTEVARAKWNAQLPIEDLPREQALLASLRERAEKMGLTAETVNNFFKAQITAAKLLQNSLFDHWRAAGFSQFQGVADIAGDLRPQIDRVTSDMLQELSHWYAGAPVRLMEPSAFELVNEEAVRVARLPLVRP
jgi:chorismate mutase-like protein